MTDREPPLTTAQLVPMLTGADTIPDLEAALRCVPVNPDKMKQATARFDFTEPNAADRAIRWALTESGIPGPVAEAFKAALTRLCALKTETPEARERRESFEHARHLVATLGTDHPATILAMIRSMELAEPGSLDRIAAECAVVLPAPSHCTDDGAPLYSSTDIAEALGKADAEPHVDFSITRALH